MKQLLVTTVFLALVGSFFGWAISTAAINDPDFHQVQVQSNASML